MLDVSLEIRVCGNSGQDAKTWDGDQVARLTIEAMTEVCDASTFECAACQTSGEDLLRVQESDDGRYEF